MPHPLAYMDNSSDYSSAAEESKELRDTSPKRRKVSNGHTTSTDAVVPSRIKKKATVTSSSPTATAISVQSNSLTTNVVDTASFQSLGVEPWLVAALSSMQIMHPTPIQAQSMPAILDGSDCIGGSRTGSGKTVAFAVPILQQWAKDQFGVFALVLTPTRELALQIFEQIKALSARSMLKAVLVTGGADMRAQAIALSARPHIVVATPGRLAEHIDVSGEETVAGFRRARFVVLDEADRLLAPGKGSQLPDVEKCVSVLPSPEYRQTLLFTATVTAEVNVLKDRPRTKGRAPLHIVEVDSEASAIPTTLLQTYQLVPLTQRETYLHVLLSTDSNIVKSTIIFCNRTTTATYLEFLLRLLGHSVTALHSGLQQRDRTNNLSRFRARASRIMVATDVAARGLDIPTVDLVVNYDLPRDPDDYIHRVGRTARAGKKGTSITLVGQRDVLLVQAIEARVRSSMFQYEEKDVSVAGRVAQEKTLKLVGDAKREAVVRIEEGRDVKGNRKKLTLKRKG